MIGDAEVKDEILIISCADMYARRQPDLEEPLDHFIEQLLSRRDRHAFTLAWCSEKMNIYQK